MRLIRDKIPGQNERYLAVTPAMLRESLERYSPLRLINTVSPAGETGECLVETGEGRIPLQANDIYKLIPELLDHLIELGEISRRIKLTIGGNGTSNFRMLQDNERKLSTG